MPVQQALTVSVAVSAPFRAYFALFSRQIHMAFVYAGTLVDQCTLQYAGRLAGECTFQDVETFAGDRTTVLQTSQVPKVTFPSIAVHYSSSSSLAWAISDISSLQVPSGADCEEYNDDRSVA